MVSRPPASLCRVIRRAQFAASPLQTGFRVQSRHSPRRLPGTGVREGLSWSPMAQLTELLGRMQAGDTDARDALFAAAYGELHRLAHARLRDGGRNTLLDTTCLVHESYLRFVRGGQLRAEDRRAFFAYASRVMRSVIINSVHERIAQKRGGERASLTLSNGLRAQSSPDAEQRILAVHEAPRCPGASRPSFGAGRADAILWWLQRAGDRRDVGRHRTHGAAGLGKGTADPRSCAALKRRPKRLRCLYLFLRWRG